MIVSFKDSDTEDLYNGLSIARFQAFENTARRKLDQLNETQGLSELRVPRGNRLEALKGNRAGQHSIRVNKKWRICFTWTAAGPEEVEITNYHRG